jgi:uroporphyrinogen-III synthase/very-short-patch-repair endonuclease
MQRYAQYIIKLAREFRKNPTVTKKLLWAKLRNRNLDGLKFRRQYPIERYIVDFYCDELKLVVEVEGSIHDKPEQQNYDNERFKDLTLSGYQILRIQNYEVLNNINGVLEKILQYQNLSPIPSPIRRGENLLHPQPGVRLTLTGKTILITRSEEQSKDFIEIIESKGGIAISFPTISIEDPDSWNECDDAINNISTFNGIIFTSQNSVVKFCDRLVHQKKKLDSLNSLKIYAVGEKTKKAIENYNLATSGIPEKFTAESLAHSMEADGVKKKRFIFPRGNLGNAIIIEILTSLGADVNPITVYKNVKPDFSKSEDIKNKILAGEIDVITFTSPSTIKNFFSLFSKEIIKEFAKKTVFAVIGEVTAAAVKKIGFNPTIVAEPSTIEGMVNSIENYFKTRKT